MNNFKQVESLIAQWKASGLSASEIVCKTAEACLGWPYVWGGYGQYCTPVNRKAYADRSSCSSAEAAQIRKNCRVLSGKSSTCTGCKYYPNGRVRFFDCRGFTRWLLQQAGLSLNGAGATSQWNDDSNWAEKGSIADIPQGKVCCVFMRSGTKMSHTGMYIGNGVVIHCSGEVKQGKVTDKGWTHYAVPAGLNGDESMPEKKPVIRKGSSGQYVVLAQTLLLQQGYDLAPYGADGKFGAKTETAVKAFQRANGLNADGVIGPATWAVLDKNADSAVLSFTVTIPHLSEDQADRLLRDYPDAAKKKEA